ncbi:DUF488 domain-containing protein [Entomobacter blattae]|uniref:DUF488 domain-containing protein n=1 Tax=Entomobacter blattae TaxID=2762277 RepID=A0A7H1NP15_9PROT|nr:DUF488 domain-containing protein [Entomobacter blattae]QNT77525.1 hypothetical protein JGUZn3_02670 [Entomobacter blattae]
MKVHKIQIKRAYEEPAEQDGQRILVDRLWPRGISKEKMQLTEWLKEVAPSNDLRHWFNHDPAKWTEFREKYSEELASPPACEAVEHLLRILAQGTVTLVYGAKDTEHNQAIVLQHYLENLTHSTS